MEENYSDKINELDRVIEELIGHEDLYNSTTEKRTSFLKKRNALYSQRKYYRKKIKIMRLQKERDGFIKKNTLAKKENLVLEEMLASAKEQVSTIELLKTKKTHARRVAATTMQSFPLLDDRSKAQKSAEMLTSFLLDHKPPRTPTTAEPLTTSRNLVTLVTENLSAPHLVQPNGTTLLHIPTEGRIVDRSSSAMSNAVRLWHNFGAAASLPTPSMSSLLHRVAPDKSLMALKAMQIQSSASLATKVRPTITTKPPPSILGVLLDRHCKRQKTMQAIRDLQAQAQLEALSSERFYSMMQSLKQQQYHHP